MYKVFSDFNHYKSNILQELLYENYYLSQKDAEEHIFLYENTLHEMYSKKIPINIATEFFITYSYTLK